MKQASKGRINFSGLSSVSSTMIRRPNGFTHAAGRGWNDSRQSLKFFPTWELETPIRLKSLISVP